MLCLNPPGGPVYASFGTYDTMPYGRPAVATPG